ncbi:MAG: DUF1292 domain-containing protein [Bacillota bacterium]|nr:DUF1292 domain-containing protein [Bacillota bacterium]HHU60599.1 DUF1292 domain-containing protein [Natronincola sp.]
MAHNDDFNHDHDHEHDFGEGDSIVLVDEDDQEHTFTILEYVEIDEQLYAVLLPDENPEEGAFVFRVEVDEDGEEVLMDIEDDAEFEMVVGILESDDFE